MHRVEIAALLPITITTLTALAVMIGIAIKRSHTQAFIGTVVGLAIAFASVILAGGVPRQVTPLLMIDHYASIFMGLIIVSAAGSALLAYRYFELRDTQPEEFYLLLLLATVGAEILGCSAHFASFFLGLEILSISLYAMIGYLKERRHPLEAAIKYLILAAASSAFLLFGMALVYADSGTMEFARITRAETDTWYPLMTTLGTTLIFTGVAFKLALVPFHLWTPDVYEGAPAPVTAFIATVSKAAVFAVLLRYYNSSAGEHAFFVILSVIAVASILVGNLLALRQTNVKRILAYSSISHLGYVLIALLAGRDTGNQAVVFYLIAYSMTILAAFATVTALSGAGRDADEIDDYGGLFWRRPLIGSIFTIALLSLAGMPATAGFIGKFYLIAAGAATEQWLLIFVLIVGSAIGLFYYLRIIEAMFSAAQPVAPVLRPISVAEGAVLVTLAVIVLWVGIYPQPILAVLARR